MNSYTNSDIARIEAATGLQFAGYLGTREHFVTRGKVAIFTPS